MLRFLNIFICIKNVNNIYYESRWESLPNKIETFSGNSKENSDLRYKSLSEQ